MIQPGELIFFTQKEEDQVGLVIDNALLKNSLQMCIKWKKEGALPGEMIYDDINPPGTYKVLIKNQMKILIIQPNVTQAKTRKKRD